MTGGSHAERYPIGCITTESQGRPRASAASRAALANGWATIKSASRVAHCRSASESRSEGRNIARKTVAGLSRSRIRR